MQDYARNPQANQRKGGLLCLAAAAVGLGEKGGPYLHLIVPPVLDSFTEQDSRVRYYSCEVTFPPRSRHLPLLLYPVHMCTMT